MFNKSHSGSRLLAAVLSAAGIFMGADQNESNDAVPIVPLVERLVRDYYPDYGPLWEAPLEPELVARIRDAFAAHLRCFVPGPERPWGWKLCETGYILPVVDALFPDARYVHLVRDGRDVAFRDHRGPVEPFWRKVYFDTDRLRSWESLELTADDYRRRSHVYNALHWVNAVRVGRAFGSMLRGRCLEVRYEDLCLDFDATVERVLRFAGREHSAAVVIDRLGAAVRRNSIGRHRAAPPWKLRQVLAIERPLLLSLGYLHEDPVRPRPTVRARARQARAALSALRGARRPG